jgi:hypothetical protein
MSFRLVSYAVSAAAIAIAVACSSYSGAGDGPSDSGTETGTTGDDAGVGDDASKEAAPDGPWCELHEPNAAICDDFDSPGTFSGRWEGGSTTYNATMKVVTDMNADSPPGVLHIETEADAGDVTSAYLELDVSSAAKSFRWGCAMRVDHVAAGNSAMNLFEVNTYTAKLRNFAAILLSSGKADFNQSTQQLDGGAFTFGVSNPLPALDDGAWHRILVDAHLDTRALLVSVDDKNAIDTMLGASFAPGRFTFFAGLVFADKTPDSWTLTFDDVWLEWH